MDARGVNSTPGWRFLVAQARVVPSLPPRLLPVDEETERVLKRRTLTNLYNERPARLSHSNALDGAVFAAYGWPESVAPESLSEEELLGRLLGLNLGRGGS